MQQTYQRVRYKKIQQFSPKDTAEAVNQDLIRGGTEQSVSKTSWGRGGRANAIEGRSEVRRRRNSHTLLSYHPLLPRRKSLSCRLHTTRCSLRQQAKASLLAYFLTSLSHQPVSFLQGGLAPTCSRCPALGHDPHPQLHARTPVSPWREEPKGTAALSVCLSVCLYFSLKTFRAIRGDPNTGILEYSL